MRYLFTFLFGLLADLGRSCPDNTWTYSSYNDMCYLFSNSRLSWTDARDYCSSRESNLLSPTNREAYTFVKVYPPWIDLTFGTGGFLWNGQTRANYTMWLANEPSDIQQCVAWRTLNNDVSYDGWKSMECKYLQPVVCQLPSKTCKTRVFTRPKGKITSMGFPRNYDNNIDCYYHIIARMGFQITILIHEFYTEVSHDILHIYDGANTTAKLLARKSGRLNNREVYRSTGNTMTLLFRTDNSVTKHGWFISYEVR